ncbi:MAG: RNA polymerase sigma factor [Pseudomonadota bacterium]
MLLHREDVRQREYRSRTSHRSMRRANFTCDFRPLACFAEARHSLARLMKKPVVQPKASGLAQIYGDLRPELFRFLVARVGDRIEAEDLLQELWVRVHAANAGPLSNGRAYLYRAAQNLVLDRARAERRRAQRDTEWAAGQRIDLGGGEPADARPNAETAMLAHEEAAALATAIRALPESAGRAFRMHKIEGLPHVEIAARLGISRSGVEKHIALAMAHLRRALKD